MSSPKIRLGTPKQNDNCAITIYFLHNKQKFRFSLGIDVNPNDWDEKNQKIKGRSKEVISKNHIIRDSLARANGIITEYFLKNIPLTPKLFSYEFENPASREDFLAYWKEEMESQFNRRLFSESTMVMHARTLERLRDFKSLILFSEINRKLIEKFDAWHTKLLNENGFEGNSQRGLSLKYIGRYLNCARNDGKEFIDPFQNFKFPKITKKIIFLEEDEILRLFDLYRDKDLLMRKMEERAVEEKFKRNYVSEEAAQVFINYIRAFLFQCFTGVRDSDLRALTHAHIQGDLMIFTPIKTRKLSGKTVFFPMNTVIHELISTETGPLFRIPSNQKYNKALKVIAKMARIDKNLTSHVGRHTFGSMMVANGVSLVSLTDLMGVTSVKTVMIYAHSSLEQQRRELNRAVDKFIKN